MNKCKLLLVLVVSLLSVVSSSFAQKSKLHAGAVIGNPTGLTVKYWFNSLNALEGTASWDTSNEQNSVHVNITYLIHSFNYLDIRDNPLALFYGVGGKIITNQDIALGVRGVAGSAYFFTSFPVDISLELAPVFYISPSSTVDLDAGLGIRYHF
ncbi:MAG: hypothetical protein LCH54_05840 [Bacteroidetes bacterium]|nr:hypothetical protein [Bacteroidota bacterium]